MNEATFRNKIAKCIPSSSLRDDEIALYQGTYYVCLQQEVTKLQLLALMDQFPGNNFTIGGAHTHGREDGDIMLKVFTDWKPF